MRVFSIISFLLLLYTGNIQADISIRYDSIGQNNSHPFSSIMIKRELVRINQPGKSAQSILINMNSGDIVQMNKASQRYFKTNAQTIDQYVTFYKQNKSILQGLIDQGLSYANPQQREQVEQFLKQYNKPVRDKQLSIKTTAKNDQILGVPCNVLAIFEKKVLKSEVCMSDYEELGFLQADVQSLKQLKAFIQQFRQSAPKKHQPLFSLITQNMPESNGIPMKVVNYHSNGRIKNIIQAAAISLRTIPRKTYSIPPHYQQHSFPLL